MYVPVNVDDLVPVVIGDQINQSHVILWPDLDRVTLHIVDWSVIQTLWKPWRDKRHLEGVGVRVQGVEGFGVHCAQQGEDATVNLKRNSFGFNDCLPKRVNVQPV